VRVVGVRVKLRVRVGGRVVEAIALANSGYETDEPQLLVPYTFLIRNSISLDELGRPRIVEFDTAGGPISMHVYPKACSVAVVEPDKTSREVVADLAVSPVEREVLMSDALIEELGIIILSPRSGLWRFKDDPLDKVRRSYPPEYY
jgi:hypothetical protein